MKYVIVLALASAALSWSVSPAAAQVISTVAGTRPVAFHLMGGFGETRFQFVQDIKDEEAGVGGACRSPDATPHAIAFSARLSTSGFGPFG